MTNKAPVYPLDYSKPRTAEPATVADRISETASSLKETAKDAAADAQAWAERKATDIRHGAEQALDAASEYKDKAEVAVHDAKAYAMRSLKQQPLTTLAIAAAAGFVIGALWKK